MKLHASVITVLKSSIVNDNTGTIVDCYNFEQPPDVTIAIIDTLLSKNYKVYSEPTMTEDENNTERIVNL